MSPALELAAHLPRLRRVARIAGGELLVAATTGRLRAVAPRGRRWAANGARVLRPPLRAGADGHEAFARDLGRGLLP